MISKTKFIVISAGIFLVSCKETAKNPQKNNVETINNTKTVSKDTVSSKPKLDSTKTEAPKLKNAIIDGNYFTQKTAKSKPIEKADFEKFQINKIIPQEQIDHDPEMKIKVLETLFENEDTKIMLIANDAENESTVWLIQYDSENKLVFSEEVYYSDIVEGFYDISAKVKGNKVVITTQNSTDDDQSKEVKTLTFDKDYKFILK